MSTNEADRTPVRERTLDRRDSEARGAFMRRYEERRGDVRYDFSDTQTILPELPKIPGISFLWVRADSGNKSRDAANLRSQQERLGYDIVTADMLLPEWEPMSAQHGNVDNAILVQGMLLMYRPVEVTRQHLAEIEAATNNMADSIKAKTASVNRSAPEGWSQIEMEDYETVSHKPVEIAPDAD